MDDLAFDDLEIASAEVVKRAARNFAAALVETTQFKIFEQTADRFRQDQTAQQALQAYQEKQMAWRALLMLNALSSEQRNELESLRTAFIDQQVVQEYLTTQTDLATLCQMLGDTLSESVGLNYAASCGASCCG